MPDPIQALRYRPEIDGLRAVAVAAVLARVPLLVISGGYDVAFEPSIGYGLMVASSHPGNESADAAPSNARALYLGV